jgi:hypothetical protein
MKKLNGVARSSGILVNPIMVGSEWKTWWCLYEVSQPYFERVWGETHTFEMGTWESSGTSETSKFDCRGQNTLHRGGLYIIGKLWKCRCCKWACIGHLDIWSTRYGKKKGRESNWQFDSRPLKVGIDPISVCASGVRHTVNKLSRRATSLL